MKQYQLGWMNYLRQYALRFDGLIPRVILAVIAECPSVGFIDEAEILAARSIPLMQEV